MMNVFENDLKQLYRRKSNEIFEYTGRHILNDDSIIVDDSNDILQFFVNIIDENNKRSLLIDKLLNTYSIEKMKLYLLYIEIYMILILMFFTSVLLFLILKKIVK
jgi:hypothetical protein